MMNKTIINFEVKINSLGKVQCDPNWYWDTSQFSWNDYDLWTVLNGKGTLKTPNNQYDLQRGDCFILKKEENYIGYHDKLNPLIINYIHFNLIKNNKVIFPDYLFDLYTKISNIRFFFNILKRILYLYNNKELKEANYWLKAALIEIARQKRKKNYSGIELQQYNLISKICEKIDKNPEQFENLNEIIKNVAYSKDHFIRIFKKFKGKTPYEYIINSKIEKGRSLLLNSTHDIGHISEILGYKYTYHFSKQFKNKTGFTPSKFRSKINKEK